MDKTKIKEMKNIIEQYNKLELKISNIHEFISLPDYVINKWGDIQDTRIVLTITHGNGSNSKNVVIDNNNSIFNLILNTLKDECVNLQEQIEKL